MGLSSATIDHLRRQQESLLPDVAVIRRFTLIESGDGGSATWADLATDVPCRVSPTGSTTPETMGAAAGIAAISRWTVWLPAGTDVTERDRIVALGRTFEVQRVGIRSYETVREAVCRLVA